VNPAGPAKAPGDAIALIAGDGVLPLEVARAVEASARPLLVLVLAGIASPDMRLPGRRVHEVALGRLQQVIDLLAAAHAGEVVLAGGVHLSSVFDPRSYDGRTRDMLDSLPERGGNAVLQAILREFEKEGVLVRSALAVAPALAAGRGLLAGPEPAAGLLADAAFAHRVARELALLDVGQTVVVKGRTVVAAEAAEGTDRCIRRAGGLCPGGARGDLVAVKAASPSHDFRVDVPTAGPATVRALAEAGGGLLALEAGRSFLLGREEVVRICRETGVSVWGMSGD
jgi:DUF1009 family protein